MAAPGSLRQGLRLAQRLLPAPQTLEFSAASGSITRGGTIASLQWSKPGTTVIVQDLSLDWSLGQLLGRRFNVRKLHASSIIVRLTPQPKETSSPPFVMPAQVVLPLRVSLPIAVDRITIESIDATGTASAQLLEQIEAYYAFDGVQHDLRIDSAGYGQSRAQALLSLHATNLTLHARVAASLRDLSPKVPFAMQARLVADGTLAGEDAARVQLSLTAREVAHDAPEPDPRRLLEQLATLSSSFDEAETAPQRPAARTAELQLVSTVHPWRTQPVEQLDLRARQLDAAAFHVAAPTTLISGEATVQPVTTAAGSTWDAQLSLRNAAPGGFDEGRLPARELAAEARLADDLVAIESARIALAGPDPAGVLTVQGELPIEAPLRGRLQLQLARLNLKPLLASLPTTRLDGAASMVPLEASAATGPESVRIRANASNSLSGPLDTERLPLDRLQTELVLTPDLWRLQSMQLQSGAGQLQMQGQYAPQTRAIEAQAQIRELPLRRIHREMATDLDTALSGRMSVRGDLQSGLDFDSDIQASAAQGEQPRSAAADWEIRALQLAGRWEPTRLTVSRIHMDALRAQIDGSDIDIALPGFERVQARVRATAPGLTLEADATMQQQSGGGRLNVQLTSAAETVAWLNGLPIVGGSFGTLEASGAAVLQAQWQGGWRQWVQGLQQPARYPQLSVDASLTSQDLALQLPGQAGAAPLRIDVQNMDARVNGNLATATLVVDGDVRVNDAAAALQVRVGMTRPERTQAAPRWQLAFEQFLVEVVLPDQDTPWTLQLSDGLQATVQTGALKELQTTAGKLTLTAPADLDARRRPLEVSWQPLLLRRGADGATRVQSKGEITGIQPGWLDGLRDERDEGLLQRAGLYTNLLLSGSWDVQLTEELSVQANVRRDEGDVWLVGPQTSTGPDALQQQLADGEPAGLKTVDLALQSRGDDVDLSLDWDTENAGTVTARVGTQLSRRGGGWALPDEAPLRGTIQARLRDLGVWGIFAPPGWRMQGRVDADIQLSGNLQQPLLHGSIDGAELDVRSVLDGVELHQGTLRAVLDGQRMRIEQLVFQGGTGSKAYVSGRSGNLTQAPRARGSMTASGTLDWTAIDGPAAAGTGITMDLQAKLERMQVLVRNDRQLTVSGELSAGLAPEGLRVRGDLQVDRATILLPEGGAPTLGDDVIVVRSDDPLELIEIDPRRRRATGELSAARAMDVEIQLDLGRDLALHGMGITTRLAGRLQLRSPALAGRPFLVFGEVRTVEGRYRAWGQALDVETGVVGFNGSYDNPSLNLLAIRPQIDVRAGVRVTGTLNAPRVDLYSDPALPEAEVLTWVVLGRATATPVPTGEGNSMQRAALGLLAGRAVSSLSGDLGVDELGLNETALSVGKRISDELYVTYAQGLSGAASTLYLFYDITRKLTLRGEAGEVNAVDLIYTISFD